MPISIRPYLKKIDTLFIVTVIVPTIIACLYFGFLASDVYISESRFVIRSPDKPAASGLGVILKTAGFSNASDEVFAVKDYVTSRDALVALDSGHAVEKAYTNPDISMFDRFNSWGTDDSREDLFRYFQKKVSVDEEATSSITTLNVRAFTPQDAYRFNRELLAQAEAVVNRINERGHRDLITYAQVEVAEAQKQAARASVALAEYRGRKGVIDPEKQATVQIEMISKLQDQLILAQNQLAQLTATVPDNPQIPPLRSRIAEMKREIEKQTRSVAGGSGSLSQTAIEYQRLSLENEFASKQLSSAMNSLLEARNEAQRKQAYVERIVEPNLPDASFEPRRIRSIFATFIVGLIAWAVLGMLLASVREHRE
jgi:BexC/CtrB/KpsE family polysaccharide export inner-membrane protein